MKHAAWRCQIAMGLLVWPGCGANMQAVYEGDVRFEHCMALDVQPQVANRRRRECWIEWAAYYSYGQTRDRVSHAQLRVEQLGKRNGAHYPGTPRTPGPGTAD